MHQEVATAVNSAWKFSTCMISYTGTQVWAKIYVTTKLFNCPTQNQVNMFSCLVTNCKTTDNSSASENNPSRVF